MNSLLAHVGLLLRAAFAFLVSLIVAGPIFVVLVLGSDVASPHAGETMLEHVASIGVFSLFVAAAAGMLIGIPVFIAIIISEVFGLRGLVFHLGVGAAIGLVAVLLWSVGKAEEESMIHAAGIVAGAAGAWAYWLLAGRRAGTVAQKTLDDRATRRALTPTAQKEP